MTWLRTFGLMGMLALTACRRDEIGQGVAIDVVTETRTVDPFNGEERVAQAPAAKADVYLIPFGQGATAVSRLSKFPKTRTNAKGRAVFDEAEGRFRAWVDVDQDGRIDATSAPVRSGERTKVVVSARGEAGENQVFVSVERETYHPGDKVKATVWGTLSAPRAVTLEVWNDAGDRKRLLSIPLDSFTGEFTTATEFTAGAGWPLTPASRLADYLVVPTVAGTYFEGVRFSLRKAVSSYSMSGLSIQLNGGAPVTGSRNVSAGLTGTNVSTVALSEDASAFAGGGVPRLPFASQVAYQLSSGDGPKTVWAMFYDVDGNFAGPVSDAIYLDTQPVVPVTGMTVTINFGAAVTNSRAVDLELTAVNAAWMGFAENPALFPNGVIKYPYATSAGFQLSAGDGPKTVWVMYYDPFGRYYGPVSDTIALNTTVAPVPVTGMSLVINGGALATADRNVDLDVSAYNASLMSFSENPAALTGATRFPYAKDFGFRLSAGDGAKTIWAAFFDTAGAYFGPVSASINLVTQPTTPITNLSLLINGGAPATNTTNVMLTLSADNAVMMAVTENPALFPYGVVRYPYQTQLGYILSAGEGTKTVWAMFYDQWGKYAGPVSASIVYDHRLPPAPDVSKMYVLPNPPGQHDFLFGFAGAVTGDAIIKVYKDPFLTQLLIEGVANADGSFTWLDIGDGSAGNVFKTQDWIFITATNQYGNESPAAIMVNDSTAPEMRTSDWIGNWTVDSLGPLIGNVNDVFQALYMVPASFAPATDVVGGEVDFSQFGGPSRVTMETYGPGQYAAYFTLPASLVLDQDELQIRVRVYDAAWNYSAWATSGTVGFSIDTIPPSAPTISLHSGANGVIKAQWKDSNLDSDTYLAVATSATNDTASFSIAASAYCSTSGNSTRACIYQNLGFDIGSSGFYSGTYPVGPLFNCMYWNLIVQVTDDGGNISPFSSSVSDYVTLPAPSYTTWSGIQSGSAMLAFSVGTVDNADAYEVDFSTATGAPYAYALTGYSSPFTVPSVSPTGFIARFDGLPSNTVFYTSMRSADDASGTRCYSSYASETTQRTELHITGYANGATRATMGGALATVRDIDSDGFYDLLVGSPYPKDVTLVSGNTGAGIGSFGTFEAPDSYTVPGTPLAAGNLDGPADAAFETIVGSPLETVNGNLLAGRVRVYDHDRTTVLASFDGDQAGQQFGYSVTTVRVRTGGYTDFAVGGFGCAHNDCGYVQYFVDADEGPGRVSVISGQTLTITKTFTGDRQGDYFGVALAGGRDITGDGVADFVIGAPGSGYVLPTNQVVVVNGSTLNVQKNITLIDPSLVGRFRPGAALALIKDVTGDGTADLVVGNPAADRSAGEVILLKGGTFTVQWTQSGALTNAGPGFGAVLATGGDVNGDGISDVVVGAPLGQQNFFYGAGSAYVLNGATGEILYEFRGWDDGAGRDGSVGYSVLLPGNLNAGPRAEWVVGAPGSAYNGYQSGKVYIFSTDW